MGNSAAVRGKIFLPGERVGQSGEGDLSQPDRAT